MRTFNATHLILLWAIALALAAAAGGVAICVGSTGDFGWPDPFLLDIRRDRALCAALAGAALAAAGVGYQAVLRNPLAEPYLLGASGGAALAAFAWTLPPIVLSLPAWLAATGQQAFAFIGALLAVGIVLALAGGRGRLEPTRAVLVGVVVGVVCGGIFALLVQLFREPAGGALSFLFGRVPDPSEAQLWVLGGVTGACVLALAAGAGPLASLGLAESEAAALGVRVNRARWGAILVASLAAAAATAVAGPIGFVGLMGPHLGRLIVGPDVRRLLPIATALGAVLLCLADAAGRYAVQVAGTEIAAGVLTNLLGGPFFLLLLYGRGGRTAA